MALTNPQELNKQYKAITAQYKETESLKKRIAPLSSIAFVFFLLLAMFMLLKGVKLVSGLCFLLAAVSLVARVIIDKKYNSIKSKRDETGKVLRLMMEINLLDLVGCSQLKYTEQKDFIVSLKSRQAVTNYDDIKFFKEYPERLNQALSLMQEKENYAKTLRSVMQNNQYQNLEFYYDIEAKMKRSLANTGSCYVLVKYTSPAGRESANNTLTISKIRLQTLATDKSLLMTKSEYNKYLKEESKEQLETKQHTFYKRTNRLIDAVNVAKDSLIIKKDIERLDLLIADLFDRTINSIKKIKTVDSEEWDVLDNFISGIEKQIGAIFRMNQQIIDYYQSSDFLKIKTACDTLMNSQKEFNEYIDEKVKSITSMFGTAVIRNETVNKDEYNYIHPYKKSITPFTAEVSANVFASAENSPLEYVIKYFYPDKTNYPEQIQKLQILIEELETLKEAKQIIENYKAEVKQYLSKVPLYIMKNDEDGFYSRLGFATINENTLVVNYKFAYTSNGGKAQRSFTVPMTEETIIKLIQALENKLTMSTFSKEQRSLMTAKLRQTIKERDNFTCRQCGNSTYKEPNLLLEIDHIIPVAKGGCTEESNLQTLCWKCNRSKGAKI